MYTNLFDLKTRGFAFINF